jgi:hypothetical protein
MFTDENTMGFIRELRSNGRYSFTVEEAVIPKGNIY